MDRTIYLARRAPAGGEFVHFHHRSHRRAGQLAGAAFRAAARSGGDPERIERVRRILKQARQRIEDLEGD